MVFVLMSNEFTPTITPKVQGVSFKVRWWHFHCWERVEFIAGAVVLGGSVEDLVSIVEVRVRGTKQAGTRKVVFSLLVRLELHLRERQRASATVVILHA